jgi:hypothetical protein
MNRRSFLRTTAAAVSLVALPLPLAAKPDTENLRSVELYDRGQWKPGTWAGLRKNDIFRLRDPDGTLVNAGTEHEICIATSDVILQPAPMHSMIEVDLFTTITKDHRLASRVKVVKDGHQVGLVLSFDLRTHTMRRVASSRVDATIISTLQQEFGSGMMVLGDTFDYIELGPEEYGSEMAGLHLKSGPA